MIPEAEELARQAYLSGLNGSQLPRLGRRRPTRCGVAADARGNPQAALAHGQQERLLSLM